MFWHLQCCALLVTSEIDYYHAKHIFPFTLTCEQQTSFQARAHTHTHTPSLPSLSSPWLSCGWYLGRRGGPRRRKRKRSRSRSRSRSAKVEKTNQCCYAGQGSGIELYVNVPVKQHTDSRAYLLPWTAAPFGPVTWAASGPLAPWITMNSTVSPSPTLRRYLLGLFLMIAVQTCVGESKKDGRRHRYGEFINDQKQWRRGVELLLEET